MVAPILSIGTLILACAGNAAATKYTLAETYDYTNFFDKFNFFVSKYGTGNYNDVDPGGGYVNYRGHDDAVRLGLINTKNKRAYIGVEHKTVMGGAGHTGRSSVRVESKNHYNHGLLIARFTHLPAVTCSAWPSFWTYGNNWPYDGEVDIYEGWNKMSHNQPAFHTYDSSALGQCLIDGSGQSASLVTKNCDNGYQNPPVQYENQGCAMTDDGFTWGSSTGGIYAMEWTSDFIKLYNWRWSTVPSNVASKTPDTSTWGEPVAYLKNSNCNINKHFSNQKLVLNLDFCGAPAGFDSEWSKGCKASTGQPTCIDYAAKSPSAFANYYMEIQDIRYFH